MEYSSSGYDSLTRWSRQRLRDYSPVLAQLPVEEEFVTPIKPCTFTASASVVTAQDVSLCHLHIPPPAIGLTILKPDYTAFILPVSWQGELRINGVGVNSSSLYFPSEQEGYCIRGENRALYGCALNREHLIDSIAALQGVEPDDIRFESQVCRMPNAVRNRLLGKLGAFVSSGHDRRVPQTTTFDPVEMAMEMYDMIANTYILSTQGLPLQSGPIRNPQRILFAAEEYFLANIDQRVSLTELCQAAGVSKSTLYYAFGSLYGESPISYFRKRRLMMARSYLLKTSRRPGAVKYAALNFGFNNLGRFAGDYYSLFGEYPVQSLES